MAAIKRLNFGFPEQSDDTFNRWLCDQGLQPPDANRDEPNTREILSNAPASVKLPSIAPPPIPCAEVAQAERKSSAEALESEPAGSGHARSKYVVFAHRACVRSFKLLDGSNVPRILGDIRGRFRVWTATSGAHRQDKMSLDYRLRESTELKEMVIDLLEALNSALQEGELCKEEARVLANPPLTSHSYTLGRRQFGRYGAIPGLLGRGRTTRWTDKGAICVPEVQR